MNRVPVPLPASEELNDEIDRFLAALDPLFFPSDPISHDVIRLFSSLLRVSGIEDVESDPFGESRSTLEDLNRLMQIELPTDQFPDPSSTVWRLGLQFYCHIVEMSAPYEVIANLLRFRLKEGYEINPFYKYLNAKDRKRSLRHGISTYDKIKIIKELSQKADINFPPLIDRFYKPILRNAVTHSDYILTNRGVISREGYPNPTLNMTFSELDQVITSARAFISAFFGLETEARRAWGMYSGKAIPYDPIYKGMMEVLSDDEGLMNGFKIHWPNGEESFYRRTVSKIDMVNCFADPKNETVQCFVGLYASNPGRFSPLVEQGQNPIYSAVEGCSEPLTWNDLAAAAKPKPFRGAEPLFQIRTPKSAEDNT